MTRLRVPAEGAAEERWYDPRAFVRLHRHTSRGGRHEARASRAGASFVLGSIVLLAAVHAPTRALAEEPGTGESAATTALTREQARELESPLPYDDESIREGRKHYLRLCQSCHGKDGRALESFDFEASDLTAPDLYRHGSSDGDLFFSTKEGAGMDMPPFKDKLSDRQVWEIVWFLRSLGPESARPQPAGGESGDGSSGGSSANAGGAALDESGR